jgi:hypothetical protein
MSTSLYAKGISVCTRCRTDFAETQSPQLGRVKSVIRHVCQRRPVARMVGYFRLFFFFSFFSLAVLVKGDEKKNQKNKLSGLVVICGFSWLAAICKRPNYVGLEACVAAAVEDGGMVDAGGVDGLGT